MTDHTCLDLARYLYQILFEETLDLTMFISTFCSPRPLSLQKSRVQVPKLYLLGIWPSLLSKKMCKFKVLFYIAYSSVRARSDTSSFLLVPFVFLDNFLVHYLLFALFFLKIFWFCRENFFKPAGEIVDVRFATNQADNSFRGFGHVEFASAEEAEKVILRNTFFYWCPQVT